MEATRPIHPLHVNTWDTTWKEKTLTYEIEVVDLDVGDTKCLVASAAAVIIGRAEGLQLDLDQRLVVQHGRLGPREEAVGSGRRQGHV